MPHRAKKEHYQELKYVMTMAEAQRVYFCHRSRLAYAIDAGNLAAVKCGKIWLISVRSLNHYFGLSGTKQVNEDALR